MNGKAADPHITMASIGWMGPRTQMSLNFRSLHVASLLPIGVSIWVPSIRSQELHETMRGQLSNFLQSSREIPLAISPES